MQQNKEITPSTASIEEVRQIIHNSLRFVEEYPHLLGKYAKPWDNLQTCLKFLDEYVVLQVEKEKAEKGASEDAGKIV